MRDYDVIVIGVGPAGATAAAIVADSNLHTLLIEKGAPSTPEDLWRGGFSTCVIALREGESTITRAKDVQKLQVYATGHV